jgi:hypothetical protein
VRLTEARIVAHRRLLVREKQPAAVPPTTDEGADPKLRALRVPDGSDRHDLIAFLRSLGDGEYDRTIPARVPSGLAVGGAIH